MDFDGASRPVYDISLTFTAVNGGEANVDRMRVSISADDSRVPLFIDGSLKIGHLICRYVGAVPE